MASNHTPNIGLCQWSADDMVLRSDYNADNAKLDEAISERAVVVTGTYTGDGAESREIVLGFRPKYVRVWPQIEHTVESHIGYSATITEQGSTMVVSSATGELTDQGFRIFHVTDPFYHLHTNIPDTVYFYLAIR